MKDSYQSINQSWTYIALLRDNNIGTIEIRCFRSIENLCESGKTTKKRFVEYNVALL